MIRTVQGFQLEMSVRGYASSALLTSRPTAWLRRSQSFDFPSTSASSTRVSTTNKHYSQAQMLTAGREHNREILNLPRAGL